MSLLHRRQDNRTLFLIDFLKHRNPSCCECNRVEHHMEALCPHGLPESTFTQPRLRSAVRFLFFRVQLWEWWALDVGANSRLWQHPSASLNLRKSEVRSISIDLNLNLTSQTSLHLRCTKYCVEWGSGELYSVKRNYTFQAIIMNVSYLWNGKSHYRDAVLVGDIQTGNHRNARSYNKCKLIP